VSAVTAPVASRLFRIVAVAEACSWAGLLIGMFFKYVATGPDGVGNEIGVTVFGPIHGALFVAYLVVTLLAARVLRWSLPTTLLALAASIPPLATLWFERRARGRGQLSEPVPSAR
jgi:integral membrane protein